MPENFQHALDDEHHVRTAGIVFVEHKRRIRAQAVWQNAFAEFRDLLAVLEHDRVLAHEINAGDVAVEVYADARPVESGRHLLDVCGLACTVVALHHHATVVLEPGEDRERHVTVEEIIGVKLRHVLIRFRVSRHLHVRLDAENLTHRQLEVGQPGDLFGGSGGSRRAHGKSFTR